MIAPSGASDRDSSKILKDVHNLCKGSDKGSNSTASDSDSDRGPGSGQPSGSGQSSGSAAANPGGGVIGPEDYGG